MHPMLKQIPPVTRNLLIAMLAMFLLQMIFQQMNNPFIVRHFALFPLGHPDFMLWQLLTYAFLHGDLMHLLFNGLVIWMFGSQIEFQWGDKRFATFILVCILGSAITHLLFVESVVVGISGAGYGLLVAYAMMWPDRQLYLIFPPMPVKAKHLVIGLVALSLFASLSNTGNVAHLAHFGGALTGFLLIQFWRRKPPFRF